nr:glycosyltransferase [Pelagicoccus mobilis]
MSNEPLAEGQHQPSAISHQPSNKVRKRTVLAIASAGGHWVQLLRLRPAFEGTRIVYATTQEDYKSEVVSEEFYRIPDGTRWDKIKLLKSAWGIFRLILKIQPDTIITTGAAPGYFAIRIGKLLRKKTVWIDSIANAEELSLSGTKVGKHATLWLTQWKHLAHPEGPHFYGNVLGDQVAATVPSGKDQQLVTPEQKEGGSAISHQPLDQPLRIFVTVGSDVPFDRLLKAMDEWADSTKLKVEIFAQVGNSDYSPQYFEYTKFLTPSEFKTRLSNCDYVVAHTGMGTILSALRQQKPILTLPRHGSLGETRNDHQIATANHLLELGIIEVAFDETELKQKLEKLSKNASSSDIPQWASNELTKKLNSFSLS